MKIKGLLLAGFLVSTMPLVHAADLLEVYRLAQSQDAVISSARASYQAGLEKLPQARSQLLPSINLTANTNWNENSTSYRNPIPFPLPTESRFNTNGYAITLVQPLFRMQNWIAYTEAELQITQSEAQLRSAEQDLILRTAQAYFDVLIAQDTVQLAATQKSAINEQLAQAKRNFEVGAATITDTYEAQARHDLTGSQEIAAQNRLEISKLALQQITQVAPWPLARLNENLLLTQPPGEIDKWVEDARQGNPQVVVARAGAELANKEVARNRGGHYPTLDLVASRAWSAAGNSALGIGSDNLNTAVGVQLNMPLYQGGAVRSKVREAEANSDRAKSDLENALRSVSLQARQAYLGMVDGMSQVQALKQALKSSESLLEASKLGQEVGVRTNLDVLNAQQQYYATRRDLYQAQYNYLMSALRLKAAVGVLAEPDLEEINRALR